MAKAPDGDDTGLSSAEAARRLAADGANSVAQETQHPIGRAVKKFWAPVPWMLESTIALQLGLGEYPEALAIAVLLVFNAALSFFREGKAQATLDALKSAAGIVLTDPGLEEIVAVVEEGRATFQRILTFTFRSLIHKTAQVLLLAGLVLTGGPVLTPMLMVLLMAGGDFFALTSATDNVHPSPTPNVWRLGNVTLVSVVLGLCDLDFRTGSLAVGHYLLHLDTRSLQTLTVVTMIYGGQAIFYVARERMWRSRPASLLVLGSSMEVAVFSTLASQGYLMAALSPRIMLEIFGAAMVLALVLDSVKLALFRRYPIL